MKHSGHETSMRSYYAARAPSMRYDRLSPQSRRMLDEYAAFVQGELRGLRVLEIACGTGYWTEHVAHTAEHVHATDVVPEMIELARDRRYARSNVSHARADAYTLDGVASGWSGGFHFQWLSHVPRARWREFLDTFHSHLAAGAVVVCGDNIDRGSDPDEEGNLYQWRQLPGHPPHRIIKNCPSELELETALAPWSRSITHRRFEKDWFIRYVLDLEWPTSDPVRS